VHAAGDVDLHKSNDIIENDSIYRKKLIDGDKFRRKSNASGRKVKKIGTHLLELA